MAGAHALMTTPDDDGTDCHWCSSEKHRAFDPRKVVLAVLLIAGVVVLGRSEQAQALMESVVAYAAEFIRRYPPALGMAVFVVFSALSAMLAFFSSAALVPVVTQVWGAGTCMALLWLGWVLGGAGAYALGRRYGERIGRHLVDARALKRYRREVSRETRPWMLLLLQLALPSEVPGYLAGTVRYPFHVYAGIVAAAEIPYALGTVFLGESFLDQNVALFAGILVVGLLASSAALYTLHRRMHARREPA